MGWNEADRCEVTGAGMRAPWGKTLGRGEPQRERLSPCIPGQQMLCCLLSEHTGENLNNQKENSS